MTKSFANHQVKWLASASVIVFVWFVWRLGVHHDVHFSSPISHGSPTSSSSSSPSQPTDVHHADAHHDRHPDVLDAAAADQYCSNFRLKPFPRDRVNQRKIYDLLLINTELEMLEVRMGQMAPGVDYFVILESDKTFTDKDKPLHVQENWAQFARYHKQMIRRTMDLSTGDFKATWDREAASRNAMYSQVIPYLEGDEEASKDDVLLVSDVDEMFKPETLKLLRNCEIPDRVTAQSNLFYYSFQWVCEENWPHPQATVYKGKDVAVNATVMPQVLRSHTDKHMLLRQSAWHCSYCFPTVAEFVKKITSFSHTELDKAEYKDPEKIVMRVRNGHDVFERKMCDRVENNPDVPQFLMANKQRFGYMLDRDPENGNFIDYTPPKKEA